MEQYELKEMLTHVADGSVSVEEAVRRLKRAPFEEIGIASLDAHRGIRQGASEIIYGAGKTAAQIVKIAETVQEALAADVPFTYFAEGRIGLIGKKAAPRREGYILVATGGTSDIPVAEEAALTAEILGNHVRRVYDVGVAGLHRLLAHLDDIMGARVIIAIAGMEGALASVIGGLTDAPVIAVPTSVGYGTALGGVTALLSMLNSCASGVSVVNIDNGFGAGYLAGQINNMEG